MCGTDAGNVGTDSVDAGIEEVKSDIHLVVVIHLLNRLISVYTQLGRFFIVSFLVLFFETRFKFQLKCEPFHLLLFYTYNKS